MRLFAISMSAWRMVNEQPEVVMQSVVGLLIGESDAHEELMEHARRIFPEADGWQGHQFILTEIPQGTSVGPFRLSWQVERQPDTVGAQE